MDNDKVENPVPPKEGETRKQFMARFMKYTCKHHPNYSDEKKAAICYDMWRDRERNQEGEIFTSDVEFQFVNEEKTITNDDGPDTTTTNTRRMIALVGDRFMNGGFFSFEELKKCYKQWDGTLHDINHMGTSTGFFLMQQDITYFVGYHSNVKLDKETKSLSMDINIVDSTKFAAAWKGYIDLCQQAGQIPNVSVTYFGHRKFIPASDLPKGIDWKKEGYGKDDLVPVLYNVTPICVSTVHMGKCNDKDGCGIRDGCSYNFNDEQDLEKTLEKAKQEMIERIKKLEKN
jgi:hypothetical protein